MKNIAYSNKNTVIKTNSKIVDENPQQTQMFFSDSQLIISL